MAQTIYVEETDSIVRFGRGLTWPGGSPANGAAISQGNDVTGKLEALKEEVLPQLLEVVQTCECPGCRQDVWTCNGFLSYRTECKSPYTTDTRICLENAHDNGSLCESPLFHIIYSDEDSMLQPLSQMSASCANLSSLKWTITDAMVAITHTSQCIHAAHTHTHIYTPLRTLNTNLICCDLYTLRLVHFNDTYMYIYTNVYTIL